MEEKPIIKKELADADTSVYSIKITGSGTRRELLDHLNKMGTSLLEEISCDGKTIEDHILCMEITKE